MGDGSRLCDAAKPTRTGSRIMIRSVGNRRAAMAEALAAPAARLDPRKFQDPFFTATGERRAPGALKSLATLWFNTGTLCNLTSGDCYIESSPKKYRVVYLSAPEVAQYPDEIDNTGLW